MISLLRLRAIPILILPIIIFFIPVIFAGKLPLPADTIPGLYHPMRDAFADQYPNGPPFKNFLITDSVRQQYPWRQLAIDQLKSGHLPVWNPYNLAGTPLAANFQSAPFYPGNIIFWLTDFSTGWSILVILQPIIGALGLYYFLRFNHLHRLACLFGAFTWIFSGFFVAWLEWNTAGHVAAWTPIILLSIQQVTAKNRFIYLPLLTFALVAQFYAGYPQPWIYLSLLQLSFLLWHLPKTRPTKIHATLSAAFVAAGLLILPLALHTYQFTHLTNRQFDQGNLLTKPDWFLPYSHLIQLIVPDYFGNPATLNYWGVFNYTEFVSFIGVIPFIFVLHALFTRNKKFRQLIYFACFWATVSLIFATRNPLSLLQFQLNLPFIGSSQPSRWIVVLDFVLPILSAIGLHTFLKHSRPTKPLILTGTLLALIWLITTNPNLVAYPELAANQSVAIRNLILPTLEFALTTLLVFLPVLTLWLFKATDVKTHRRIRFTQLAAIGLVVISVLVGFRFARKFTPFSNPEFLYPDTQITNYLQQNADLDRYMTTDRRLIAPNLNLPYRLYTIEGYDPLYLSDYARLLSATHTDTYPDQPDSFNRILTTDQFNSPVIDLLGVKYILSLTALETNDLELIMTEGDTYLYQNPHSLPRAFTTQNLDLFSITEFTPATIIDYQPNKVIIHTQVSEATNLILTDAWYPNWSATVNGQSSAINNWYGLRAINIPEGSHEIIFEYRYPHL